MTRTAIRLSLPACAALLLVACGEDRAARDTSGDRRTAAGEVRGGTISDAMLPLDSVRSQGPPLAARTEGGAGESSSGGPNGDSETGENTEDDPDAAIDALTEDLADDTATATGDYEF